ncbi:MAG: hypothetical protein K6E98_01720 [Lachnospiraceae bacterium]|nr:hypothetical protein [Lachnospiraceae bacterium]
MKKLLVMVLTMGLVFSFAGCKKAEAPVQEAPAEAVEEAAGEKAEEETTEADEASEEKTEDAASTGEVMKYGDFVAAAVDDEVVVETYVQAKQSWWEDKATVYTQDEDGAYFLYEMACSQEDYDKLTPGTKIKVKGYKAEWEGEVEIVDATFEIEDGNFIAEAEDVTSLLGTDDIVQKQNKYVAFKDMKVEPSKDADGNEVAYLYKWDGSGEQGDDLYFNVSSNGETYNFTVESYLCDKESEVYKAVEALEVGQTVDLEGFLYWYQGINPHITKVTVK